MFTNAIIDDFKLNMSFDNVYQVTQKRSDNKDAINLFIDLSIIQLDLCAENNFK